MKHHFCLNNLGCGFALPLSKICSRLMSWSLGRPILSISRSFLLLSSLISDHFWKWSEKESLFTEISYKFRLFQRCNPKVRALNFSNTAEMICPMPAAPGWWVSIIFIAQAKGLIAFLFDDFSQTQLTTFLYEDKLAGIYVMNDCHVHRLISSVISHFLNVSNLIHGFHLPH